LKKRISRSSINSMFSPRNGTHRPLRFIVRVLFLQFTMAEDYYLDDDCRNHCNPTTDKNASPSPSLTGMPSFLPSMTTTPTYSPTISPRVPVIPSNSPSIYLSMQPSIRVSSSPTKGISPSPSGVPAYSPLTKYPSIMPSHLLSSKPTNKSTDYPSLAHSPQPSNKPSSIPSGQPTDSPARVHSSQPSNMPSLIPLNQPTVPPSLITSPQPSVDPSLINSHQPTDIPSLVSSSQPSNMPSLITSDRPTVYPSLVSSSQSSISPSLIASNQPTYLPSQPSNRPSLFPVMQKSIAPSLVRFDSDLCQLSTTGFYGTMTAKEVLINYNYEMNYLKSYDRNEILNNLEHTISGVMVNSTIPECTTSRKMQETEQQGNSEGSVMGISSSPRDLFVKNCPPQPTSSSGGCSIINGTLTLYLRDTGRLLRSLSEVDRLKTAVGEIIADRMNSGDLAYAHQGIISLRYISDDNENQIISTMKNAKEVEVSNRFPNYGWVILSCGTILFLIAIGIVGRKRALKMHKKNTLIDLEIDGNDV